MLLLESVSAAIKTPEVEHESFSSRSPEESPGTTPSASPVIDADLARMEALLDNWCLDLKRNVLVSLEKLGLHVPCAGIQHAILVLAVFKDSES